MGEIYSEPLSGGTPTVLHSFGQGNDGEYPNGHLIVVALEACMGQHLGRRI